MSVPMHRFSNYSNLNDTNNNCNNFTYNLKTINKFNNNNNNYNHLKAYKNSLNNNSYFNNKLLNASNSNKNIRSLINNSYGNNLFNKDGNNSKIKTYNNTIKKNSKYLNSKYNSRDLSLNKSNIHNNNKNNNNLYSFENKINNNNNKKNNINFNSNSNRLSNSSNFNRSVSNSNRYRNTSLYNYNNLANTKLLKTNKNIKSPLNFIKNTDNKIKNAKNNSKYDNLYKYTEKRNLSANSNRICINNNLITSAANNINKNYNKKNINTINFNNSGNKVKYISNNNNSTINTNKSTNEKININNNINFNLSIKSNNISKNFNCYNPYLNKYKNTKVNYNNLDNTKANDISKKYHIEFSDNEEELFNNLNKQKTNTNTNTIRNRDNTYRYSKNISNDINNHLNSTGRILEKDKLNRYNNIIANKILRENDTSPFAHRINYKQNILDSKLDIKLNSMNNSKTNIHDNKNKSDDITVGSNNATKINYNNNFIPASSENNNCQVVNPIYHKIKQKYNIPKSTNNFSYSKNNKLDNIYNNNVIKDNIKENSNSYNNDIINKDGYNSKDTKLDPSYLNKLNNNNNNNNNNMYKELDIKLNYNYNNEANNNTLSKINSISQLNSNIDICKENNNTYNNYLLPDTISVKKSIKDIVEFTRTGFQGDEEKANNQDIAIIYPNFMDNNEYYFLSVCDGHGVKGHDISGYIKQKLPFNLQSNFITNNLVNIFDSKSKNKLYSCIEEVFIQTNNNLNNNSMIDTNFSGSTCVSLFLSKDKIITANIGDSRAVMGKLINKSKVLINYIRNTIINNYIFKAWVSKDLSRDHKPSDKDESIRINMKGGRIEPYRDDDGEFIGPSRIWLKEEDLPGLAMSRSFGDMVAASVGCISCPGKLNIILLFIINYRNI